MPGLASSAAADSPPVETSADYNYARYVEDDISSSKLAPASTGERYEIDIHQLRFLVPVGNRFDLGLDLAYETMSGASPWYVDDSSGEALQVMSGATIEEERTDVLVSGHYYLDSGRLGATAGVSIENDYLAINGGLSGERNFPGKNTTLSGGVGFSYDEISPEDADQFRTRQNSEDKQSYSGFASISQVINRHSLIESTINIQHSRGFLSDPYKLVLVGIRPQADTRPDERTQISWLTSYRQHFARIDGTVRADYRFYIDDWGTNSHTMELAWHQTLFRNIQIIPSVRYYSQKEADFYAISFPVPRSDGYQTSDYRLSTFGALSWRLKAEAFFELWRIHWLASVSWERYVSSDDLSLHSGGVENPGLVSFNVYSVGLEVRF